MEVLTILLKLKGKNDMKKRKLKSKLCLTIDYGFGEDGKQDNLIENKERALNYFNQLSQPMDKVVSLL